MIYVGVIEKRRNTTRGATRFIKSMKTDKKEHKGPARKGVKNMTRFPRLSAY